MSLYTFFIIMANCLSDSRAGDTTPTVTPEPRRLKVETEIFRKLWLSESVVFFNVSLACFKNRIRRDLLNNDYCLIEGGTHIKISIGHYSQPVNNTCLDVREKVRTLLRSELGDSWINVVFFFIFSFQSLIEKMVCNSFNMLKSRVISFFLQVLNKKASVSI